MMRRGQFHENDEQQAEAGPCDREQFPRACRIALRQEWCQRQGQSQQITQQDQIRAYALQQDVAQDTGGTDTLPLPGHKAKPRHRQDHQAGNHHLQ
jgi:hypothetical protein